jgi:hypothetical protein
MVAMSEKNFWVLLRTSLKGMKMYRVENRVMKGMPDVHYIKDGKSGWIELKYMKDWPRSRMSTGLKLNQSLWLKEYDEQKGQCWVLLRVGRDFVGLIHGRDAKRLFERPSRQDFFKLLSYKKLGNMKKEDWEELESILLAS